MHVTHRWWHFAVSQEHAVSSERGQTHLPEVTLDRIWTRVAQKTHLKNGREERSTG